MGPGESHESSDKTQQDLDECLVCSDQKRNTLFLPCAHVAVCFECGERVKKCLICKEYVDDRKKVEDCLVCSEKPARMLFKPCNHLVACGNCAQIIKKCVECRTPIDHQVPFKVCCGGKMDNNDASKPQNNVEAAASSSMENSSTDPYAASVSAALSSMNINSNAASTASPLMPVSNNPTMNNGRKDTTHSDVQKLQQQLNDIKEQVRYKQISYYSAMLINKTEKG